MIRRLLELQERLAFDPERFSEAVRLIKRLHAHNEELLRLIEHQENEEIRLKRQYTGWGRAMLEEFLILLDCPENEDEFREKAEQAVQDLKDEEARLSEFVR